MAGIPYVGNILVGLFGGVFIDWINRFKLMTDENLRKAANSISPSLLEF